MKEIISNLLVLPFFFLVLWRLGKSLYREKKDVLIFVCFTALLYGMCAFMEGREVITGIFLNGSNGLTLLSCVVMLFTFSMILEWLKRDKSRVTDVMIAVILILAGQYCDGKGGFYIFLMLLLAAAVKMVRKGYAYVITSGRFKKRI